MLNWLNTQLEWLKSFLSEKDGKASIKRALSVAVVTVFLVAYLKVSLFTARAGSIVDVPDIPATWAMLIAAILGFAIYSNSVDNKHERLMNGKSVEPDDK